MTISTAALAHGKQVPLNMSLPSVGLMELSSYVDIVHSGWRCRWHAQWSALIGTNKHNCEILESFIVLVEWMMASTTEQAAGGNFSMSCTRITSDVQAG